MELRFKIIITRRIMIFWTRQNKIQRILGYAIFAIFMFFLLKSTLMSVRRLERLTQDDYKEADTTDGVLKATISSTPKNHDGIYLVVPKYEKKQKKKTELVIFVQSKTTHFSKRQLVRDTWANVSHYGDFNLFIFFAIGLYSEEVTSEEMQNFKSEMSLNMDILLLNKTDTYENLSIKGLLTMTWVSWVFTNAYVIKTDDDVLLNIYTWIQIIKQIKISNTTCCIICYVWINGVVFRSGKYAVSKDHYPYDNYPSFCSGAAYLITPDAMAAIVEASVHIPMLIRDDPYFTGIVAQAAGINLISLDRSHYKLYDYDLLQPQVFGGPPVVVHGAQPPLWLLLWEEFTLNNEGGRFETEIKMRQLHEEDRGYLLPPLIDYIKGNVTLQRQCSQSY